MWVPIGLYLALALIMLAAPFPKNIFVGGASIYVLLCLGPAVAFYVVMNMAIRKARPHMRRRVESEFGQPNCWDCGYNLRGNESGVCPECGSRLTMHRAG